LPYKISISEFQQPNKKAPHGAFLLGSCLLELAKHHLKKVIRPEHTLAYFGLSILFLLRQ
jgi:hypothetical protein